MFARAARWGLGRPLCAATLLSLACGGRATKSDGPAAAAGAGPAAGVGAAPNAGAAPNVGGTLSLPPGGAPSNGGTTSSGGASAAGCPADAGGSGGSGGYDFVACAAGQRTLVSGVVRDPAGRVPVYNALVYVLSGTLSHLPEGSSCDACAESVPVPALTTTFTDENGKFELEAPAGVNVPLVVQIGKWRRKLVLPIVKACTHNPLDGELTRLPRRQSEGTMPRMAVTSGQADSVPCFLRRLGIADEEFTTPEGAGHVHVFADCNAGPGTNGFAASLGGSDFPAVSTLYQPLTLRQYDAVLLGCDDGVCPSPTLEEEENLEEYANSGGRVFLQHAQSAWLQSGPSAWQGSLVPQESPQAVPEPLRARVEMSFPKGDLLAKWLVATGASSQLGELELHGAGLQYTSVPSTATHWLSADASDTPGLADWILALTLRTPVASPLEQQCGRVTFTDFHVVNPNQPDDSAQRFPEGCAAAPLSPQEKLLEFLLFDRAACVNFKALGSPRPPLPRPPTTTPCK